MNIGKLIIISVLSIALLGAVPASADEIPAERQLPLLVDDAGLLDSEEFNSLLATLEDISDRNSCEVAVVTVETLGGKSAEAFADDFYDYNGYGAGTGDDGVMLVIAMTEREFHITTYGFGITAITDHDIGVITEKITGDLSDGDYYDAFTSYADYCDYLLNHARNDSDYSDDGYTSSGFHLEVSAEMIFVSLGIGLVIALIIVSVLKAQLKSVRANDSASLYTVAGSMKITNSSDLYLYRTLHRTPRPRDNGGSGGGSRTHMSSSGRSHGGGGGRF